MLFASLGLGFRVFFEITLIQQLVLFLGYSHDSLTMCMLSSLLISVGIGAYLSGGGASPERARCRGWSAPWSC